MNNICQKIHKINECLNFEIETMLRRPHNYQTPEKKIVPLEATELKLQTKQPNGKEESLVVNLNGNFMNRRRPRSLDLSRRSVKPKEKLIKVPSAIIQTNARQAEEETSLGHHDLISDSRLFNFSLLSTLRRKKSRDDKVPPTTTTVQPSVTFCVRLASFKKNSPKVITALFGNEDTAEKPMVELPLNDIKVKCSNDLTTIIHPQTRKPDVYFCDRHQSERKSVAVSTCACLKEVGAICHHHGEYLNTQIANGSAGCSHISKNKKDIGVGTNESDGKPDTILDVGEEPYQRTAGDDLYLQAIICIVIILVVLAVGSAMMSSIQKILQNRAQNRIPIYIPPNFNPNEKIPLPKDIGSSSYDHLLSSKDIKKDLGPTSGETTTAVVTSDDVKTSSTSTSEAKHLSNVTSTLSQIYFAPS